MSQTRHVRLGEQRENEGLKQGVGRSVIPKGDLQNPKSNFVIRDIYFRGHYGKAAAFSKEPLGPKVMFPLSKIGIERVQHMKCNVWLPHWLWLKKNVELAKTR